MLQKLQKNCWERKRTAQQSCAIKNDMLEEERLTTSESLARGRRTDKNDLISLQFGKETFLFWQDAFQFAFCSANAKTSSNVLDASSGRPDLFNKEPFTLANTLLIPESFDSNGAGQLER